MGTRHFIPVSQLILIVIPVLKITCDLRGGSYIPEMFSKLPSIIWCQLCAILLCYVVCLWPGRALLATDPKHRSRSENAHVCTCSGSNSLAIKLFTRGRHHTLSQNQLGYARSNVLCQYSVIQLTIRIGIAECLCHFCPQSNCGDKQTRATPRSVW